MEDIHGRLLWAITGCAITSIALILLVGHSVSSPKANISHAPQEYIYVEVEAQGVEPTVVRMPKGTTMSDVMAYLGLKPTNLPATTLKSGQRIEVHPEGTITLGFMTGERLFALGIRIPLNKATVEDLIVLPGIGEKMATKIVDFRRQKGRISSYDDLLLIRGLGPRILKVLKDYTTLED